MRAPTAPFSDLSPGTGILATPALLLGLVLLAGLIALVVIGLRALRDLRELKLLREAQRQALLANDKVSHGLKTMATIMPLLRGAQSVLSERAMDLLDTQSSLLIAVLRANKKGLMRRPRSRRLMAQRWRKIAGLDRIHQSFQEAVLMAVCEQAAHPAVLPPLATGQYRAAFSVLEHRLPFVLWPAMNQILAQQAQLWVCDATGTWTRARRLGFRWGKELVFSRKLLEQATELRLVVADRVVSEFTVEHERAMFGRFGGASRPPP